MPSHKGQIYQKKDCNGCKALQERKCVLGYRILLERSEVSGGIGSFFVPVQQCPKPRTHAKLGELLRQGAQTEE